MQAEVRAVESNFLGVHAVVDHDLERAPGAHEELVRGAVGVLAADLLAGNAEHEEIALRHERQCRGNSPADRLPRRSTADSIRAP